MSEAPKEIKKDVNSNEPKRARKAPAATKTAAMPAAKSATATEKSPEKKPAVKSATRAVKPTAHAAKPATKPTTKTAATAPKKPVARGAKTAAAAPKKPVARGAKKKTPFVQFKDVHKIYHMGEIEVAAVDGMSFDIAEGEFVCIVGPSGSGKTTLLNMLGGMDTCTSGEILLAGERIDQMNEEDLTMYRRDDVGFVFQFYNLVQNLTARENVELASQINVDPLDPDVVLEQVGLGDRKDNFPAQLSGGEQQRVAIARALAKNPQLLLCDEPTGALDYETGKQIVKLLQDTCHQTGKTVIIITHNTIFESVADRVIRVRSGRVVSVDLNAHPADALTLEW